MGYLSHGAPRSLDPPSPGAAAIVFDPRMERGAANLGERLREPMQRHSPSAWVIRGSSADFAELLENDAILPDLAKAAGVPVLGLAGSHDRDRPEPRLWSPSWSIEGPTLAKGDLCDVELTGILERTEAIYRREHFHYVLPSRYHAAEFIRLADALQDPIDTVRLVDWLLPYLRPDSWVIADTGTLLPLLFALRAEAQARFDFDLQVANLSEYPSDYVSMEGVLGALHGDHPAYALLIVSISSSGRVAEQFERLHKGEHDVVVICDTGASGVEALARYPIERWKADEHEKCERCEALNELVIDPHTYQVLPVTGIETVRFDFATAAEQEEFWRLADRTDAVELHFDEEIPAGPHPGRRHMSINIDIPSLLEDESFRQKVTAELSEGGAPDRVLIPDHDAAEAMAALVLSAFPDLDPERIHRVRGAKLDDALVDALGSCERVLLLDDSTVTGKTLISLRREIYHRIDEPLRPPRVEAFVVLDRPPSDSDGNAVRRTFTQKGEVGRPVPGFRYVERVLLPAHDECPWCVEDRILGRLAARIPDHAEFIRERTGLLSSMEGLRPPLLPTKEDRSEQRTHDSFIGDLRPAAAFAATASAAHGLTLKLLEMRKGEQVALVDVGLVAEAFFDQIIVAGLLRVVPPRFLRHRTNDEAVNHRLSRHAAAFGEGCLTELAWAAVQGCIPREAIHAVLSELEDPSPALRAYRALLEVQDPTLCPIRSESPAPPVGTGRRSDDAGPPRAIPSRLAHK